MTDTVCQQEPNLIGSINGRKQLGGIGLFLQRSNLYVYRSGHPNKITDVRMRRLCTVRFWTTSTKPEFVFCNEIIGLRETGSDTFLFYWASRPFLLSLLKSWKLHEELALTQCKGSGLNPGGMSHPAISWLICRCSQLLVSFSFVTRTCYGYKLHECHLIQ